MQKSLLTLTLTLFVSVLLFGQLDLVDDLRPGVASALPTELEGSTDVLDGVLFFPATADNTFRELLRSDGTADGTFAVQNGNSPVNTPNKLAATNEYFVFRAVSGGNNTLWASDGTNGNTKPIYSGAIGEIVCIAAVGNRVFFEVPSDATSALWVTDGTQAGTTPLTDADGDKILGACEFVLSEDGDVYFIGEKQGTGSELWITDGTSAGTMMVEDIMPGDGDGVSGSLVAFDGRVFFSGNPGNSTGAELWASDGTSAGTAQFLEIRPGGIGSMPMFHYADDNAIYFDADNGTNGRELWRSDGSVSGTALWAEVNDGPNSTSVIGFSPFKDGFIAQLFSSDVGFELHTISNDGNVELITELVNGTNGIFITDFVVLDDKYFFATNTPQTGEEMWRTDGTENGTYALEIVAGSGGSSPDILGANENGFFVSARRGDIGRELFYYDKTTSSYETVAPTVEIELYPNPVSDRFFIQMDSDARVVTVELYQSNGQLVTSIDGARTGNGIDVSGFEPGLYHVTLHLADGMTLAQKIVKQ